MNTNFATNTPQPIFTSLSASVRRGVRELFSAFTFFFAALAFTLMLGGFLIGPLLLAWIEGSVVQLAFYPVCLYAAIKLVKIIEDQ